MRTFLGPGRKHYANQEEEVSTGKIDYVIKIREITLTQRACETITFQHMHNLLPKIIQVIFTPLSKKLYFIVCKLQTKRHTVIKHTWHRLNLFCSEDYTTLPYGYRIDKV